MIGQAFQAHRVRGGWSLLALAVLGVANMFGFSPFQLSQTDRSQPALLKSIKDISQYHAAVGNFEVVLDIEDDVAVDARHHRRTADAVCRGGHRQRLRRSVRPRRQGPDAVPGRQVGDLRLPEPQLDKPNLDHDRSYVYKEDRGVVDRIADAIDAPQQAEFYKLAETKMAAAAEESELRERAAENTKAMLTGMFGSLGIQVTFLDNTSG